MTHAIAMRPASISAGTSKANPMASLRAREITPAVMEDGNPGITFLTDGLGARDTITALPLAGKYNAGNALAATAICHALGVPASEAICTLSSANIPGRCEPITYPGGPHILIDYAHNEKSLRELLVTMRDYLEDNGRLFVLFGSVGERTRERRAAMGAVASEYADFCILTSDNPGTEDPMDIIREIHRGFVNDTPYLMIPDRREAILKAISLTGPNDLLLLAGKGHENYQLIGKDKLPFSEREIVLSALSAAESPT
jgi:UDP-N-acetylmuramoyl-L-alanyl-D-glutamate--2,6-diaminopimelate ligase